MNRCIGRALLLAGDLNLYLEEVRPHVTKEHCFVALAETLRQGAYWGIKQERLAGSA